MTPKTVITVTIVLMTLHGLGLALGAEEAAKLGIENISAAALNMGQGAFEVVAMFNFFLVAVLVPARQLDTGAMRTLSRGIAIGYLILFAGVIYHI